MEIYSLKYSDVVSFQINFLFFQFIHEFPPFPERTSWPICPRSRTSSWLTLARASAVSPLSSRSRAPLGWCPRTLWTLLWPRTGNATALLPMWSGEWAMPWGWNSSRTGEIGQKNGKIIIFLLD